MLYSACVYVCFCIAADLLWKRIKNYECLSALIPSLHCFFHSQEVVPLLRLPFFFSIYVLSSCFMYVSFIRVCICTCVYIHIHIHTCLSHTQMCVYTHIHTCIYIYLHTHMHTHICTRKHSVDMHNRNPYIHVCTHVYAHSVVYPKTLRGWHHFGGPLHSSCLCFIWP